MQMNVTAPAFTGKTAYTKQGNEYNKTNTFAKVGLGVGIAAAAGIAAYENKEAIGKALTKENLNIAKNAVVGFFTETVPNFFTKTVPNLFKKAPKVAEETAEAATAAVDEAIDAAAKPAAEAAEAVADAAAETAKKPNKIKAFFNSIGEAFKKIDMKKAGKATGKIAVIAAPVILLTAAGLVVDKLNNNKKAREADLNA